MTVVSTPPVIIEQDWNGAVIRRNAMATISAERTPVLLESAVRMDSMPSFVRLKQITENFRGMPKIGMSPSPKKIIRHEYEKNRVSL